MTAVGIAPSIDQPTITSAACGASVLQSPTIGATSVGFMREKRTGVAETAPGVAQSSTNQLDLTGSTHYRYPMIAAGFIGTTASNPGQYVSTNFKPGSSGTVQNCRYQFAVEFVTSSPQVAIRMNSVATNSRLGRLYVNGALVSSTISSPTSTAGSGTEIVLTFSSAASRTIKIIGFNSDEGRFGGVDVAAGYTVLKPTAAIDPIYMVIGDSYVNGAGTNATAGANDVETWIWELGEALGYTNIFSDGIGGTGFVTDTGGLTNNYSTRTGDITTVGPETLIIAGGRNDGTATTVQAALDTMLAAAASIPTVYVSSTCADSQTSVIGQLSAGAAARSRQYIGGFSIDALPKIADGIHLTQAGHHTFEQSSLAAMTTPVTPMTSATSWAVRASVTPKTSATSWNTLAPVVKTSVSPWAVRSAITPKTAATSWATRFRIVPKTSASSWNVRQAVSKTASTTWNVLGTLTSITKTLASTWNVRATVEVTSATAWKVRAAIAKATSTTWSVRTVVAPRTVASSWKVRAAVAATLAVTSWTVRTMVARTLSTTWQTLSSAPLLNITVTATLRPSRWDGTLADRPNSGTLRPNRWTGTLR